MNPFKDRDPSIFDIDEKLGVYTCPQTSIVWLMFIVLGKLFPNRDFKDVRLPEADHCKNILKEKCPDIWNRYIEGQEDLHIPVPDFEECIRVTADDFLDEEAHNHFDRRFQTVS